MVIVQDPGDYLKGDFVKANNITQLTVMTEAAYKESQYGKKLEAKITCNDIPKSEKIFSFNKTNHRKMMELAGNDTAGWVGKIVNVTTVLQNTPQGPKEVVVVNSLVS